jgi:hypothetical protein
VVLSAGMLAGTASGSAALGWFTVRDRWRWPLAIGAGALIGALAATLILIAYGHRTSIVVLAVSVFAAAVLGGALGAIRPAGIAVAGIAGTLAVFFVGIVLHSLESPLDRLFGAHGTADSQVAAGTRVALTTSLLGGLAAGLIAFGYLRRAGTGRRFLPYLAAGALPGVLLLLTELVTRVGGMQLFTLIRNLSPGDRTFVDYWDNSRLDHALVVLFVGAIVALLCFGRTLTPTPRPAARPAATPAKKAKAKVR